MLEVALGAVSLDSDRREVTGDVDDFALARRRQPRYDIENGDRAYRSFVARVDHGHRPSGVVAHGQEEVGVGSARVDAEVPAFNRFGAANDRLVVRFDDGPASGRHQLIGHRRCRARGHPRARGIQQEDAAVATRVVVDHHRDRLEGSFERCATRDEFEDLGLVGQHGLGLGELGDVAGGDHDRLHQRVVEPVHRGVLDQLPMTGGVARSQYLGVGLARVVDQLGEHTGGPGEIIGVNQIEAGAPGPPVELIAEHVGELAGRLAHKSVFVDERDGVGGAL